ncbi:MAG: acetyl-CoA carboxylase biotin carboxyl carrier protein subunit [Bacteroidales bacterium]|nr:acetyl-CoA carboxylase biotin carboxyl carrier protein subunit [Bacteroidales bacterium]MDD3665890.1 acetyl-CoA carboxylase biotin carboxyl carrier protein subunit [Bacteroidales bacterium]
MEKENAEETSMPTIENLDILHVEMGSYKTIIPERFKNRKVKTPPQTHIVAQIPGNIKEIYVKEGQKIKADDKILMLVAMKMNNILTCPFSGVVKSIEVAVDQVVPKGHLLMVVEPA